MSSQRYYPNQERDIYNFRVVPELQISNKIEMLMLYIFPFVCICFAETIHLIVSAPRIILIDNCLHHHFCKGSGRIS